MFDDLALATSISSIVGADHITEEPELRIDGVSPKLLARPGCADEVAACVKLCSESGVTVVPAGRMTWLECGNPLKRVDVVLSLERMRRVIDYSPPDLTATVEAGLTLIEFNGFTAGERQWLPLDPPGLRASSLGAIAACNSVGALRLGFGTPRDYVIGMRLVHADGSTSKSGGRVAKNVAGYDMNKLYVGSFGTLAIITELTFKLRPLPDCSSTLLITSQYRGPLFQLAKQILASELQPASVVLTRGLAPMFSVPALAGCSEVRQSSIPAKAGTLNSVSNWPDDSLLVRFIDNEAAVKHQVEWVRTTIDDNCMLTVLSQDEAHSVWTEAADFEQRGVRVRLSVPLSAVPAEFEKALLDHPDCVATADIGTGIIRLAFDANEDAVVDSIKRLRSSAAGAKGSLVIEKAPADTRLAADAWGDIGSTAELMRSIKERFDPQALLNPGRFVLGL